MTKGRFVSLGERIAMLAAVIVLASSLVACKTLPAEEAAASLYADATRAYEASNYARAADLYSRAIEVHPRVAEAYLMRANCHLRRIGTAKADAGVDLAERAVEDYSRAIDLSPALSEAIYNRAMALCYPGRYLDAGKDLNACIEAPDIRMRRQAHKMLGILYEDKFEDRLADAKRHYEEHIKLGGNDSVAMDRLQRLKGVLAMFADRLHPGTSSPAGEDRLRETKLAYAEGRLEQAAAAAQELIRMARSGTNDGPSAELSDLKIRIDVGLDRERKAVTLFSLAQARLQEGQPDAAVEFLIEIRTTLPETKTARGPAQELLLRLAGPGGER